jgi:hypothetical protein
VGKCDTARQATYKNTTWSMRFACWIVKATDTNSEYVIIIAFTKKIMVKRRRLIVTLQYFGCLVEILSYEMNAADKIKIF